MIRKRVHWRRVQPTPELLQMRSRKEMAAQLARRFGLTHAVAYKIMQQVYDGLIEDVVMRGKGKVTGLGTFLVVDRASRKSVHPATQKTIHIPAKRVVKFVESDALRKDLNRKIGKKARAAA